MVLFPNCKINLGLQIKDRRDDGFHNLETVFFPIPVTDVLELVQSNTVHSKLEMSGISIDAHAGDNICMKAYLVLQKKFPGLPPVHIHLHKVIPSGAGLGGGSADGAYMLRLLNEKFRLGLDVQQLIQLALQLGSDCPFFIQNKPCYATGRGENMEPIAVSLLGYSMVLVCPRIHVSTGWAFGQLQARRPHFDLKAVALRPVEEWKDEMVNDFEVPVFKAYPEIGNIKKVLYEAGAVYAAMSGSGSTVYGIFKEGAAPALSFPEHYFVHRF